MKTLTTLALTAMMALPTYAATETENIKEVTDAYVQQHNVNIQNSMKAQVNQEILNAINSFRIPLFSTSEEMIVETSQNIESVSEQVDIE